MTQALSHRAVVILRVFYLQATASRPRRAVFAALLVWAVVDAVLTARKMSTLALSAWGFFGSFFLSLLFIGLIALAWEYVARWWQRRQ